MALVEAAMVSLGGVVPLERAQRADGRILVCELLYNLNLSRNDKHRTNPHRSQDTHQVTNQTVNHVGRDTLADDDAQNLNVVEVGREFVVGDDPALGAE